MFRHKKIAFECRVVGQSLSREKHFRRQPREIELPAGAAALTAVLILDWR
jgi:hypothetical protein